MTKKELIEKVSEKTGLKKKEAEQAVHATLETIADTVSQGGKVQILGFGNFETRTRAAREGRNPRTGEAVQIEAIKVPVFKPGKALKEAVQD